MKYDVIYCDPPWQFKVWDKATGSGRSAESYYKTMTAQDLIQLPVGDLANKNCALFLWAVAPSLPLALQCMQEWGFTYKTIGFTWVKTTKRGLWHFGMGYYTRANVELCLLGVKGSMPVASRSIPQLLIDMVRRHSEKPKMAIERIEKLYPDKRCIELFCRDQRPGWMALGNEVDGRDIREALPCLVQANSVSEYYLGGPLDGHAESDDNSWPRAEVANV